MKILIPALKPILRDITDASSMFAKEESIEEVRVEGALLSGLDIKNLNLTESLIEKSDLSHIKGERFDVLDCQFKACNFTAGTFPNSSWHVILIDGARCSGMQITNSTLKNVTFKNSKLELMNFRFSTLDSILFQDCALDDVDFNDARLKNVEFINCTINKISFSNARMVNVDLSKSQIDEIKGASSLKGATISYDQVMQLAPLLATEAGIKIK